MFYQELGFAQAGQHLNAAQRFTPGFAIKAFWLPFCTCGSDLDVLNQEPSFAQAEQHLNAAQWAAP